MLFHAELHCASGLLDRLLTPKILAAGTELAGEDDMALSQPVVCTSPASSRTPDVSHDVSDGWIGASARGQAPEPYVQ
jgi:hypothetical protein